MATIVAFDQQVIDTLKWFGLGIGWLVSAYVTYRIGRRTKHDDIQIVKRHTFAEQIAALLQRDFHNRRLLTEQYHSNFDHMGNLSEAMQAFHKHETLYRSMRDTILELPTDIEKLHELSRNSALYLEENTTSAIETYIGVTRFSFETDGIGLINTYVEDFFVNLLDVDRSAQLDGAYRKAMQGLRKAVR